MWIDDTGRLHTIAVPDWTDVVALDPETLELLQHMDADELERMYDEVVASAERITEVPSGPFNEVPREQFRLRIGSASSVVHDVALFVFAVPFWWRLDVIDALHNALHCRVTNSE